jgi:hypothetical protein
LNFLQSDLAFKTWRYPSTSEETEITGGLLEYYVVSIQFRCVSFNMFFF